MTASRVAYYALISLLAVFLLVPALAIVVASFSDGPAISIPPQEWGVSNYINLFHSTSWGRATLVSIGIAVPAGLISVIAALLVCLAASRTRLPFGEAFVTLSTVPLYIPGVALAVGLYSYFSTLRMIDTFPGMIAAHAMLGLPLCIFVMWPAIKEQPRDLELAAMSLGASRMRAVFAITVPAVIPAMISAALLSILNSLDEATIAAFLTGPQTTTLPKAILDSVMTGLDPVITAISALLMVVAVVLVVGSELARRRT